MPTALSTVHCIGSDRVGRLLEPVAPVWKGWTIIARSRKNQFTRLATSPYAPEATQTSESFTQIVPEDCVEQ